MEYLENSVVTEIVYWRDYSLVLRFGIAVMLADLPQTPLVYCKRERLRCLQVIQPCRGPISPWGENLHSQVTEREPALSGRQHWKPECSVQANLPTIEHVVNVSKGLCICMCYPVHTFGPRYTSIKVTQDLHADRYST